MITPNTRKGMGWWPQIPDIRDHIYSVSKPGVFEDMDYRSLMPPIWDQGQTSSCTAHGIAAGIAYARKEENLPFFVPSRLFIYANERIEEGDLNQDGGAEIRTGIKCVATQGAPDETFWPFDMSKLLLKPDDAAYTAALTDLVGEYQNVDINENSVLSALAGNFPVIFGVTLYSSFDSDTVAADGQVPMPQNTEKVLGGHCMVIVGALIEQKMFIVRNSWGTEWGDQGYCYMPFDYILNENLCDDFWVISTIKK